MTSLMAKFERPLPSWIPKIKKEGFRKVAETPFAMGFRDGNPEIMRSCMIRYWPFVNTFPQVIGERVKKLFQEELAEYFKDQGGAELRKLITRVLLEMNRDESDHRKLWLDTASVLGLSYGDLEVPAIEEAVKITQTLSGKADACVSFLQFAGVEISAEGISRITLNSKKAREILGKRGLEWFRVHAEEHGGMSHEEVDYRLAFLFRNSGPDYEETRHAIMHVVSLFCQAARRLKQ